MIQPGFLEIMTWHAGDDLELPDFKPNEVVKITQSKIIEDDERKLLRKVKG